MQAGNGLRVGWQRLRVDMATGGVRMEIEWRRWVVRKALVRTVIPHDSYTVNPKSNYTYPYEERNVSGQTDPRFGQIICTRGLVCFAISRVVPNSCGLRLCFS